MTQSPSIQCATASYIRKLGFSGSMLNLVFLVFCFPFSLIEMFLKSTTVITLHLISSVFGGLEVTRDNGMRWGNMGVLEDHVLRAQVISTFAVKHKIDCVFNCLDHFNCFSANLVRHQSSGTLSCELLNTDQYRNASLLADSSGNRHLFFKVHIASVFVCVSDASG